MKPVVIEKTNFNGFIQDDLKKIYSYQARHENRLCCLHMHLCDDEVSECVLFPHYRDPTINPLSTLQKNMITSKIINSVTNSLDVIELSAHNITTEFTQIPYGIMLRMNSIVKELYLDDNLLT